MFMWEMVDVKCRCVHILTTMPGIACKLVNSISQRIEI